MVTGTEVPSKTLPSRLRRNISEFSAASSFTNGSGRQMLWFAFSGVKIIIGLVNSSKSNPPVTVDREHIP